MCEYSHEGKQLENKWVFRRLQKTGKVCADIMSGGRLFQSRLPATAKARSPTVTSLNLMEQRNATRTPQPMNPTTEDTLTLGMMARYGRDVSASISHRIKPTT